MKWDNKKNLPAIVTKDFGDRKPHDYTIRAIEYAQIIRIFMFGGHPNVWDMVSSGVEHMFEARKIPIWVSFAVQVHLASQDIMSDKCAHTYFELECHVQKALRMFNKMLEEWEGPFLPTPIHYDCFLKLGVCLTDIQEWSSLDGFDKQWEELLQLKQIASHPVLKTLRKEKNYYLRHHPILCGMMKYEMYLKMEASGMKLEHQSLSISMMAHIYINARLQYGEDVPVWTDMEFIIYAQDPAWLFIGGRPKTVEETQKKLLLVAGSSAANSARHIPLHRLKIDQRKLREFRDTMMFGSGVYLPQDKFSKARINVCTVRVEDLVKRLVDTIDSPQPWGRLARQLIISNSEQAQSGDSPSKSKSSEATPRIILERYAQWLQADLVDLYFDWLQMGITCGDIWSGIRYYLEKLPTWDPVSFDEKPAMEPTIDILTRDKEYPKFLKIANSQIMRAFDGYPRDPTEMGLAPDTCLVTLGKYHKATAAMLDAPGPLRLSKLYSHWPEEKWRPRWDEMKSKPADQLQDLFYDAVFYTMKPELNDEGVQWIQNMSIGVTKRHIDHLWEACRRMSIMPKDLKQKPIASNLIE